MKSKEIYEDELVDIISGYELSDVFQDLPLPLKKLQEEYQKNFEPFRKKVLSELGYTSVKGLVERVPDTLIISFDEPEVPPELLEFVKPPDESKVADALKSCGFKTWDDVETEIFTRPEYKRFYRYERLELRFCLVLDVVFRIISKSKDRALFGTLPKESVISKMKEEFDSRAASCLAGMISYQLTGRKEGDRVAFCKHPHYLGMLDSTRKLYKGKLFRKMVDDYRFACDKTWKVNCDRLLKYSDWQKLGWTLLRVLPEYYYEMVLKSVCPSEDMLNWYARRAGNNSGRWRKQAKDRNK